MSKNLRTVRLLKTEHSIRNIERRARSRFNSRYYTYRSIVYTLNFKAVNTYKHIVSSMHSAHSNLREINRLAITDIMKSQPSQMYSRFAFVVTEVQCAAETRETPPCLPRQRQERSTVRFRWSRDLQWRHRRSGRWCVVMDASHVSCDRPES